MQRVLDRTGLRVTFRHAFLLGCVFHTVNLHGTLIPFDLFKWCGTMALLQEVVLYFETHLNMGPLSAAPPMMVVCWGEEGGRGEGGDLCLGLQVSERGQQCYHGILSTKGRRGLDQPNGNGPHDNVGVSPRFWCRFFECREEFIPVL